ncbi:MAG: hypothetical protein C7B44_02665 [Sulfobacillus thermosulfidooxidans]|nr:MAG: hypothetical protein C7B44_02665 [Sulfobacillus thermosulfidooxidans]
MGCRASSACVQRTIAATDGLNLDVVGQWVGVFHLASGSRVVAACTSHFAQAWHTMDTSDAVCAGCAGKGVDIMNQRPAIVLAGQRNDGRLASLSAFQWEAEIRVGGRALVEYVVDALRQSGRIAPIVVVGPSSLPLHDVIWAPVHDEMFANVISGLDCVGDGPVLIATADVPFLTPEAVSAFVDAADDHYDVVYPIIEKSLVEARFAQTQRTYVRLVDGTFTGGNIFMVRKEAVLRSRTAVTELLEHRKSPRRLAGDIGLGILVKWLIGRLGIEDAQKRVAQLLGIKGQALIFDYPEVGVDVDKPQDWEMADRLLGNGQNAPASVQQP